MNPNNRRPVPGVRPGTFSEAAPWVAETLNGKLIPAKGRSLSGGFIVEDAPDAEFGTVLVSLHHALTQEYADKAASVAEEALQAKGARTERVSQVPAKLIVRVPEEITHPMHWQWSEQAEHAHCEDRHYADPRTRKTTDKTKVTCPACREALDRMAEGKARAEAERQAADARWQRLLDTVQAASTPETAAQAIKAVVAADRATNARRLRPGMTTFDPVHGEARILEAPQETRTDDDRPCVLIRARTLNGNVWLRYEETI